MQAVKAVEDHPSGAGRPEGLRAWRLRPAPTLRLKSRSSNWVEGLPGGVRVGPEEPFTPGSAPSAQIQSSAWRRPRIEARSNATQAWREELYDAHARAAGRALLDDLRPRERAARRRPTRSTVDYDRDLGYPGRLPVHARRLSVDVPRQALDDAAVRRLRHRGGDERALPLPARPRPDRALDRVRHADADGLRLGPRALAGRGRPRGRRDRLARGHGDALPRHPARRGLDLDDDQLAGGDPARVLRRGRRGAGRPGRAAARDDPDGHPQGVHRAEGVHLPAGAVDAARHGHGRVLRARSCRSGTRSRSPATTSARPARRPRRSSRSRSRTASPTSSGRSSAGSTSTTSRRGSPSSSTRTSTSSRRSRSTAPRAGSGRASCATASAPATRARG